GILPSQGPTASRLACVRRAVRLSCPRRAARRRAALFDLRRLIEQDAVGHRIIIRHEGANELALVDSERVCPCEIAVGRNATASGLELRDERVVLGADLRGQFPLRQTALLAQFAQPISRPIAQLLRELTRTPLRMSVHVSLYLAVCPGCCWRKTNA